MPRVTSLVCLLSALVFPTIISSADQSCNDILAKDVVDDNDKIKVELCQLNVLAKITDSFVTSAYDGVSQVLDEQGVSKDNDNDEENVTEDVDKRKNDFLRFGKRKNDFLRFGKRKNDFLRFGKRKNDFLRFGKRKNDFLRFGKRKNDFLRFGKRKNDFLRFGKRKNDFLRFGKRKHEYLRFG